MSDPHKLSYGAGGGIAFARAFTFSGVAPRLRRPNIPRSTGDASACHLHFEIWTAPGWYAGATWEMPKIGKLVADETEKWAKVVKFAGISVE